jgi:hypothetical protein
MGELVLFPSHELFQGTLPVACPVCATEIVPGTPVEIIPDPTDPHYGIVVHADCAPILMGLLPDPVP